MGNSTNMNNLRRSSALGLVGLLSSKVNLSISLYCRKTFEIEVIIETAQLKEMMEGRSHVSAKRSLLVSITLREREVKRILLCNGHTKIDSAYSKHIQLLAL